MKKKRNFKRISTIWGENFDPSCPLSEYPRPQFQRESYLCLNGKWGFEVLNGENKVYEGEIIVPYSPETMLSGVERETSKSETLHYFRKFAFPENFIKGRVLLHFGGVDQFARVVFNGTEVTSHADGYLPFPLTSPASFRRKTLSRSSSPTSRRIPNSPAVNNPLLREGSGIRLKAASGRQYGWKAFPIHTSKAYV